MALTLRNPPDFTRWRRTTPFAVVFFIRDTISQFNRWGQILASLGLAALLVRARPLLGRVLPFAIAALVVVAALRYWCFRFRLAEDRILIRQGVFRKTSLDLPLDRVQGINIERSLTDRLLGLVTVMVDTAGSDAVEARIPSVRAAFADELRAKIGVVRGDERPRSDQAEPSGEVIMKLSAGDMVRIGLQVLAVVVPMVIVVAGFRDPRKFLRYLAGQYGILEPIGREQVPRELVTGLAELGVRAGLAAVLLAFFTVLGIYGAFATYYGFTLFREKAAYRTRGGLFRQREVVVQSPRIQQVTLSQNPVARCFGRFRLSVHAASDDVQELVVPLLPARMAEALRSELFGREGGGLTLLPQSTSLLRVSPHYIHALALKIGVAPALALPAIVLPLTAPSAAWVEFSAIWILIWVIAGGLVALQKWRRLAYMHDDDGMALRSGFIDRNVDAFLFRKAQAVTVTQSPVQRRKGLATLEVELASERVKLPYVDHGVACRLRDYILCRAQTNRRWH